MAKVTSDYAAIFKGDWRTLPQRCGGNVEIMDQTWGCPECGQNMWYTPSREVAAGTYGDVAPIIRRPVRGYGMPPSGADLLPPWAPRWVVDAILDWEESPGGGLLSYPSDVFSRLLDMVHPFQFDAAHDPGDDGDSDWWAGHSLHMEAMQQERWPRNWWKGAQD